MLLIGGSMNQDSLRQKLQEIVSSGLSAVAISKVVNISTLDLSRFKNAQIGLIDADAQRLERYLDKVQIPTSI